MNRILAVDLGSSALKLLVMDQDTSVNFVTSVPYETYHPYPGWTEQKPEEWVMAFKKGLSLVWQKVDAREIKAVSFSGHMSGVVLLDRSNETLYPCITLADTRSEAECGKLQKELGDMIQKQTGNPVINAFAAPKLLWLKAHVEEFSRSVVWVSPKDYLRYQLTGQIATDYTDAYNSLFLNPHKKDWDRELIRAAGLPEEIFPRVQAPYDQCGAVTGKAAALFGLREGTPVYAGAADMACGAVGMNLSDSGDGVITLGTSATFLLAANQFRPEAQGAVTYHLNVLPDTFYALGSHFNGGLVMNGFSRFFTREETVDYEFLQRTAKEAEKVPPGSRGILTIPFLTGSGSPYFDPLDRGTVLGLNAGSRRGELMRSALEGVAYNMSQTLSLFERLEGKKLKRIYLGGGGIRIALWPEIFAAVMGREIQVVAQADASAAGAAVIGGYGAGMFEEISRAAASSCQVEKRIAPCEAAHRQYKKYVKQYEKAYEAVSCFYRERGEN